MVIFSLLPLRAITIAIAIVGRAITLERAIKRRDKIGSEIKIYNSNKKKKKMFLNENK